MSATQIQTQPPKNGVREDHAPRRRQRVRQAEQVGDISFGEQVKRARIRNALTQSELGKKVGVTGVTISYWERGKVVPRSERLEQVRLILGITPTTSPRSEDPIDTGGEEPSPFAAWLNKARVERQMSVNELATAAGVSPPTIYAIESGRIANPRADTMKRLEKALGQDLPSDAKEELKEESTIHDVGQLEGFDPHDDRQRPESGGVYVLYDISDRPIYVGQSANIKERIRDHQDRFWFKRPIVETAAFVEIRQDILRRQVEAVLIRFLKSNAVLNRRNVVRGEGTGAASRS